MGATDTEEPVGPPDYDDGGTKTYSHKTKPRRSGVSVKTLGLSLCAS